MTSRFLVLNAGSSSLKFAIYEGCARPELLASGSLSQIGATPQFSLRSISAPEQIRAAVPGPVDLPTAANLVFDKLDRLGLLADIAAVGHRIVHGGAEFDRPVRLDGNVLGELERLVPLAPLHQPHNLDIVRLAATRLPQAIAIGCFDTAFHAGRPRLDKLYGLPFEMSDQGIVAYGFHGLSYEHIAARLRLLDGARRGGRTIVAHLGSGASLCAMEGGASVATTMGFSALDGLMMATRCGAVDPGVLLHLIDAGRMNAESLADLLYNRSGLFGVSGISGDMEELLESDEPRAVEAIDLYVYRITRAIGSLVAVLGGLDNLVFTAGIGENAPAIRQRIIESIAWLGLQIDEAANQKSQEVISLPTSCVTIRVIPADEEQAIAERMADCLGL